MTYTDQQFDRLQYLLGKYKFDVLSSQELNELRELIAIEQPSVITNRTITTDDLIKLGLVIVGIYILIRILRNM